MLVWSNFGLAQEFIGVYKIDRVPKSGWYSCVLKEDLRAVCAVDYRDIRLFEASDSLQDIPYLLKESEPNISSNNLDSIALKSIFYSVQKDQDKKTHIKIYSSRPQWIHKLYIKVGDSMFYKREWRAFEKKLVRAKPRKKVWQENSIMHHELSSYGQSIFTINHYLQDTIFIEIYNLDNPPLPIEDIKCFQKDLQLIAYFEKDNDYLIKCGNNKLFRPNYDLNYFAKLIEDSVEHSLTYTDVSKSYFTTEAKQNRMFYEHKYFVWLSISIGVLSLFFFSWKMLQEKKNGL